MDDFKGLQGAGGGADEATNTPDNLFSEDVVEFALAVSEGPIRGLTNGAKSFYVGDTALVAQDGTRNFAKFAIGVHPGFPEDSALPLDLQLGGVTSSTTVGVTLLKQVSVTRTTPQVLRGVVDELEVRLFFARLMRTNDEGTFTAEAKFQLEYKKSLDSAWLSFYPSPIVTLTGKTSAGYAREFRVTVPRITDDDWLIRVTKISDDASTEDPPPSELVYVDMSWESFQCTTKGAAVYPDTAIVHGLGVTNGQFSSLPDFSGVYDGILCRVPTNYNADLKTYDESTPWDGSFKFAWTDNPAWILYDMIVNHRYGIAAHRLYVDANRFDFYIAAKWCDAPVLISNQGSETQPRYTFNDLITEPRQALESLAYVAGSFNALVWDDLNGQVHLKIDKDDPAEMLFTPENVVNGVFNYSFTDITNRANDISVTFINPDLDWNEDRRRVPGITTDEEAIAKYGRIPLDFIAVGCTNVHEAIRKAHIRLISAQTETTMVSFETPRLGALMSLYDVILIADPTMGWSQSGRLTHHDTEYFYFRDAIYIEAVKTYVMKLQTVDGVIDINVEPDTIGPVTRLKNLEEFPPNIPRYATFTLEEEGGLGFAKPFRVTSVGEADGSPYAYSISAVELNRTKYFDAEHGTNTPEFTYSFKTPALPGVPRDFRAASGDAQLLVDSTGTLITRILASWRRPYNVVVASYELQHKQKDDADWQSILTTNESSYISPVNKGTHYSLRVRSIDPGGKKSSWAELNDYVVVGKSSIPATLTALYAVGGLFQNELNWTYSAAKDIKKVQIWGSNTALIGSALLLADLAYPTDHWNHVGLDIDKTVYYWGRVQDTSGFYSPYSAMASATTISDPNLILGILQNSITETELYTTLTSRINLIDGNVEMVNSVANRIAAEAAARNLAILEESNARAEALIQEAIDRTAAITSESTIRQTAETSLGQRIDTVTAANGTTAAAVQTEVTARTTADTALGARIDVVVAATADNLAAVQSEATARTTADTALGSRIDTVTAANATNAASIVAEQTARIAADTAEANARLAITAAYQAGDATTYTNAVGYVTTNYYTKSTSDNNLTVAMNTLRSEYTTADATNKTVITGEYKAYTYSKSQSDGNMTAQFNTLTSNYQGYTNGQINSVNSNLSNNYYTIAGTNSAITNATQTLTTTVNGHTTTLQTQATTLNGLSAQYTVKIDNNGYVSGFGLASTVVNGTPLSSFIINADKFAVVTPGLQPRIPFVVGQVNGASVVGIDGTLVVDGSISANKLTVTDLSAISANLGSITVGTANIANLSVNGTKIEGGSVTEVDVLGGAGYGYTTPSSFIPAGTAVIAVVNLQIPEPESGTYYTTVTVTQYFSSAGNFAVTNTGWQGYSATIIDSVFVIKLKK